MRTSAIIGVLALVGFYHGVARAQPVEFTARKAEVDLEQRCAELEGDVEVRRGSLRLRAPRLRVEETADGVDIEGPGALSGCSCAAPPFELGFDGAQISRDGDVDLRGPRLMSGDTTLLYLPRLMLRGPNSAGLLPPRLGYSGRDGGFLGVGAELPVGGTAGKKPRTRVRLGGGVYSRFHQAIDGGRVELDVSESGGRTRVAWESLEDGMFDVDAYGAHVGHTAGVAYRMDAARGRRALVGPLSFPRVIAPQDRARLALMDWDPTTGAYAQIRGDAARGTPDVDGVAWGAASGFALRLFESDAWRLDWQADVLGQSRAQRTTLGVMRQALTLVGAAPLGPFSVRSDAEAAWFWREGNPVSVDGDASAPNLDPQRNGVSAQLASSVGLPLSRRFGAWRHWVEPRLAFSGWVGEARWLQAEAAVDQRFGGPARGQTEASFELALGNLRGDFSREVDANYIRADMSAAGRWLALGASAVALGDGETEELAFAHAVRLRVGQESRLHFRSTFDQALGRSWRTLRPGTDVFGSASVLAPSAAPWTSPYAGLGATAGGGLWVPLGDRFATSVSSVFDLDTLGNGGSQPIWLFGSWGGAYRHPCGCLAVQALLAHRLGRHTSVEQPLEAFDVSVGIELFEQHAVSD